MLDNIDRMDKARKDGWIIQPIQLYPAYLALSSLSSFYLTSNPSLIMAPFFITTMPSFIENNE